MDFIKSWALRIVIASVAVSFILILVPSGTLEKSVKTAVSLLMLFVLLYPFMNVIKFEDVLDLKSEFIKPENVTSAELIEKQFEYELADKITELLNENDISVEDVTVIVTTVAENEISIEKVNVIIFDKDERTISRIKQLIKDSYGLMAEVGVTDE